MARKLENSDKQVGVVEGKDETDTFFSEMAERSYTADLNRGNLCAFIAGRASEVDMWEVTVLSILEFIPGMRVAVAAEADGFKDYERCVWCMLLLRYGNYSMCVWGGVVAAGYDR